MITARPSGLPGRFDVIVVGAGVAGLRAAIEAAEGGLSVALLAKDSARDSNTELAQGGVAVALSDEDEVGLHYRDTLAAGDGLCDESAVRVMVEEGPSCIGQLIDWGAMFDREGTRLAFTREGAHSARRILHARGDSTGREILRALWKKAAALDGIAFLPHAFSVSAQVGEGRCLGLLMLDETTGRPWRLRGRAVLLATGGLGRIYRVTTNPPQATGDGVAIAWQAGAALRDMEFVQFHPTALRVDGAPAFLLSEALRGEGALLLSGDGRRFMPDVDPRAELAPRDVVARAIFEQMRRTGSDHVLLDLTHLSESFVRRRFPTIHSTCLRHGVDLTRRPVPVAPAAHYAMGGVATDLWGRSTLAGLYAAGEAACTGVHGANRLASNSLLEGLVFGARAGRAILTDLAARSGSREPQAGTEEAESLLPKADPPGIAALASSVREISWRDLGIVRRADGMIGAIASLETLLDRLPARPSGRPALEARNIALATLLVARCALARQESRGAHFRSDFPARDDERFGRSSWITRSAGAVGLMPAASARDALPAPVQDTTA